MSQPTLIAAIGTPLDADEALDPLALELHVHDQWRAGIDGILVAGTMGCMQLLRDQTYADLIDRATRLSIGRGEVLVGVGDTSLARTRARIDLVNAYDRESVAGVVVLTPYLFEFSPPELIDYFHDLASHSRHPVFLYNLPGLTGVDLELSTVEAVAAHPNVAGIKASCDLSWTRELARRLGGRLRIIVAQPTEIDELVSEGFSEHLDGIFAAAPAWAVKLGRAAGSGNRAEAAAWQARIARLLECVRGSRVLPAFTSILNARGLPGNFAPAPLRPLTDTERAALSSHPVVDELVRSCPVTREGLGGATAEHAS